MWNHLKFNELVQSGDKINGVFSVIQKQKVMYRGEFKECTRSRWEPPWNPLELGTSRDHLDLVPPSGPEDQPRDQSGD